MPLPWALQHVPSQSATRPRCPDPGGRISGGLRPGRNLRTKARLAEMHEGRSEAKFVRTCPGSEPPSLRVAAGSGGGSLPLSPLPPPWRPGGRGGDVRAPPCPSLGARKGFSGGVRLRDRSGGELAGCAEAHLPQLPALPGSLCPSLPPAASPGSADRWRAPHPAPERPRPGPPLRAPRWLSFLPAPSGRDSHAWNCR